MVEVQQSVVHHPKHQQDNFHRTTVGRFLLEDKMFNILHHISCNYVSFIILKAGATLYKLHIDYDNTTEQDN
jgi:UTP-glucose-1-phosphate uridylyltransferase